MRKRLCPHGKSNCEICCTGTWAPDNLSVAVDEKGGDMPNGRPEPDYAQLNRNLVEDLRGVLRVEPPIFDVWDRVTGIDSPDSQPATPATEAGPLADAWAAYDVFLDNRGGTNAQHYAYRATIEAAARADLVRDARRYRRLQILGVAPYGSHHLEDGTVVRFTGLDAFVDADLKRVPDRGEAHSLAREDDGAIG